MTPSGIGILGGTFDPIHVAHSAVARAALSQLPVERVLLVPNNVPPHRGQLPQASFRDRLRMAQLAVEGIDGLSVSDVEGRRSEPSYMFDTLPLLAKQYSPGRFILILGDDALAEFSTWKEPDRVREMAAIARVPRPDLVKSLAESVRKLAAYTLDFHPLNISASQLRQDIRDRRNITDRLHPSVVEYIESHGLYR